jgi:coiled-coil domain-containing protein 130
MAERRATNKYYPIEWDPSKGSINTFVGQHPLRQRAAKIDQGIMVVRFELPWSTFCIKCERLLAKGVRFNAEKKKCGNYFSTTIWSFKMTCPSCSNPLEVQTDPQNRDYVCVTGLKQRTVEYEASEDNQLEKIAQGPDAPVHDPFQKLENKQEDEEFAKVQFPHLTELHDLSDKNFKNDYQNARMLRNNFKKQQKEIQSLRNEARSKSLAIDLLPESIEDRKNAQAFSAAKMNNKASQHQKAERFKIRSSSIFSTPMTPKSSIKKPLPSRVSQSSSAIGFVKSIR